MTGCRRPGLSAAPVFFFPEDAGIRLDPARELFRREPAFRATIERCDACLAQDLGWSLIGALERTDPSPCLVTLEREGPFQFAVQVALAAVWRSWGIAPGECVGEGKGAIGAAHASGRLDLEGAARLVSDRTRLGSAADWREELARLAADSHDVFIEIGFSPKSGATIRAAVERGQSAPLILSSLRGGDQGLESLRWSAASLYAAGFDIDWARVSPEGRFIRLPTYPWRHERYWLDQEIHPPHAARQQDAIVIPEAPAPALGANGQVNGHVNGHALMSDLAPRAALAGASTFPAGRRVANSRRVPVDATQLPRLPERPCRQPSQLAARPG